MKKRIPVLLALAGALLLLAACPSFDKGPTGEVAFDMDLAYPKSVGYTVTGVHVLLEHATAGVVVEEDLAVDADGAGAHGVIGDLRIGSWDLTVTLYENGTEIGSGATTFQVLPGQTTYVEIALELYAGSVDVTVTWGTTPPPPPYVGVWWGTHLDLTYTGGTYSDGQITVGADGTFETLLYYEGTSTLQQMSSRGTYTVTDGVIHAELSEVYDEAAGWMTLDPPMVFVSGFSVVGDTFELYQDFDQDGVVDAVWTLTRQ